MMTALKIPNDRPITPPSGNRLKICLASLATFIGGAEIAALRLACGLRDAGHDVILLLGQRGAVSDLMQGSGLHCIHSAMYFTDKWRPLRYWRAKRILRQVLKEQSPDVVHSNDLTTHQIVSDAARGLGMPRICHHRFCYEPSFTNWLIKFGAEHHLFVSRALLDAISSQGAKWKDFSRSVLYDGLPLPPLPTQEARLRMRHKLGLSPDRTVVIFAGQIIPRKGVVDLLNAWSELTEYLRQQAELLIIGEDLDGHGKYRVEMEELALKLGNPVQFVGFQRNVGDWLLAADIAVVPSHSEPLGNATLEAMSYSLPVIGCAVGGIPEMIEDQKTGLLVPPSDSKRLAEALGTLISNPVLRAEYGDRGRTRCDKHFSLQAHTKAVLKEYSHVLRRLVPSSVQ